MNNLGSFGFKWNKDWLSFPDREVTALYITPLQCLPYGNPDRLLQKGTFLLHYPNHSLWMQSTSYKFLHADISFSFYFYLEKEDK